MEGGYRSHNPGQGWETEYDQKGATTTPIAGGWTWGLQLASWGFVDAPNAVDHAERVTARGGRVSLEWEPALTEWWVNDARGHEHGFTIHRQPSGAAGGGPLQFSLDIRGSLRPVVVRGGRSARFLDPSGSAILSYSGLVAFDAEGKDLRAWMKSEAGRLVLSVDERGATYPITVDPIVQASYIKASNPGPADRFGSSVAMTGSTVVVGAPQEDSSGTGVNSGMQSDNSSWDSGAAYVFVKSGGIWSQQAYLKASNAGPDDRFGHAVDISGDTIVVSAITEESNGVGVNSGAGANNSMDSAGAVYVFVRNGSTWTQEAYIKASNTGSTDRFGSGLAISGDTIVVGAFRESSRGTGVNTGMQSDNSSLLSGAAYVFTRNSTLWTQEAFLKASNAEDGDMFGWSVDISGATIVVGAVQEDSSGTGVNGSAQADNGLAWAGAAYVFTKANGAWSQQAYLKASNTGANDRFGGTVAVSGDFVVVGAKGEDSDGIGVNGGGQGNDDAISAGAAYVFERSGTTWTQQAYLKASNTDALDSFGGDVDVSGNVIVVGAVGESGDGTGVNGSGQANNSKTEAGAAYLFRRDAVTWTQEAYLKASNSGEQDRFGRSVAVFRNAVIVGADLEDSNGTGVNSGAELNNDIFSSGAAYQFDLPFGDELGTSFCSAAINASGGGAGISAVGQPTVGDNDVRLVAAGLPAHTFGIFVTSQVTDFVPNPGGSQGNLCLGGSIGRYIAPGQILNSEAAGTYGLSIDLNQHPTPGGYVVVQPGDTWHFTTWFRDTAAGQPTSNFSDGLTIIFE